MNEVIIYSNVDVSIIPFDNSLYAYDVVAVPNTKEGRALFQPYKQLQSDKFGKWRGMKIHKQIMSLEAFNNLRNKPELLSPSPELKEKL